MNQKERTLVHLINLSGHSQTGYFSPIAMKDITVSLAGGFKRAVQSASLKTFQLECEGHGPR